MTQQELCRRLEDVRQRMDAALQAAGRAPSDVLLCAASKTQSIETVALAAGLNIDLFGENRVQELVEKFDASAYGQKPVHLIGHLQTNKVRQTVGRAAMIESVDSERLLLCIEKEAAKQQLVQPVLLEINIGADQNKTGAPQSELFQLLETAEQCPHILVKGLMTVPPKADSEYEQRHYFADMYRLFCQAQDRHYSRCRMEILSMGMSGDFPLAILEGSTMIRVGTALFGARSYPQPTI